MRVRHLYGAMIQTCFGIIKFNRYEKFDISYAQIWKIICFTTYFFWGNSQKIKQKSIYYFPRIFLTVMTRLIFYPFHFTKGGVYYSALKCKNNRQYKFLKQKHICSIFYKVYKTCINRMNQICVVYFLYVQI